MVQNLTNQVAARIILSPIGDIRVIRGLLFICWDFRQFRREQAFLFFLVQRRTGRRNDLRGDDQVLFDMLLDIGAERPADDWNVSYDRDLILSFLHVFAHLVHQGPPVARHKRLTLVVTLRVLSTGAKPEISRHAVPF